MKKKLVSLFAKYREIIMYAIFGALTTLVNWLSYYLLTRGLNLGVTPAGAIAWALSVLFAYATNRKWVFASKAAGFKAIAKELAAFSLARVATGALDIILLNAAVSLGINDAVAKIFINVVVIVLNFAFSKIFVFKK